MTAGASSKGSALSVPPVATTSAALAGAAAAGLVLAAACCYLGVAWRNSTQRLNELLEHEKRKRCAERQGRIRAEQKLKALGEKLSNSSQEDHLKGGLLEGVAIGMQPVGHLESTFTQRNGTPRQPLLVPAARARLTLLPHVPACSLDGLDGYSHCWIVYVFHRNTDMHQRGDHGRGAKGFKGKIKPPRLNGDTMGVLATRTPHRPNPIGLSLCQVLRVSGNTLVVGGADIIDGSPILDVKPYVPFCESVPDAVAPDWVTDRADNEPLQVDSVHIGDEASALIEACWRHLPRRQQTLVGSTQHLQALVKQVLSFDFRSVYQRTERVQSAECESEYTLRVMDMELKYQIRGGQVVVVTAACPGSK